MSASQTVEAFKLIGSAKPELLANKEALAAVTREAITLAEAAGLELPTAATALANALNQFNLPAEESSRVINALAAGSKFGAAAIPELSEAITKFGVAAASSNISIEESIGAVELLAEKGIAGAEAGTKLRNVFGQLDIAKALPPKAAKQLAKFGVNTDIVSDSTLTLQERLTELSKIQDDATALTFVFGKQNKVAAQAVLQNVDRIAELTEAVTGTDVAIEQAATNVDNLDGSLKGLSSAYEGLILSIESGDGALGKVVRSFIDIVTQLFLLISGSKQAEKELTDLQLAAKKTAESIAKVGKVLTIAVATFLAYKAGVIATTIAKSAFSLVTKGATIAQNLQTVATKAATLSMRAFNTVLKLNPLGLLLGVITAVAGALFFFREETDSATEGNSLLLSSEEDLETQLENTNKKLETRVSLLDRMSVDNAKNTLSLKELKDELAAAENQLENLNIAAAKQLKTEQLAKAFEVFDEVKEGQEKVIQTAKDFETATKSAVDVEGQLQESLNTEIEILKKLISEKEKAVKGTDKQTKATKGLTDAEKKRIEDEKKRLAEIENQRRRLKILDDIEIRAIEDATEKKKALRSQSFEEKIDQLERNGLITAEIEKALTKELQDDLTQIELDAELERQAKLKSENDKLMAELERQAKEEIDLAKKTKAEEAKIAEEALARRKEAQQEAVDLSKELVDTVIDNLTTESEAKIESLDRQINAEESFLS
ncbi:MAG: phage tail tape measure protein, partial [Planctomycetota bacterium]